MATAEIRGLYAITPDEPSTEALLEKVRQALVGGARLVQYRSKTADPQTRRRQADALAALARANDAVFIVNDAPQLAQAVDADGVHLGREDGDIATARALLPGKLVGVSCYDDLDRAIAAQEAGADYVAFGAAFPSTVKPNAAHASLDLYRQARRRLTVPIVAIGGITLANAPALIAAGVDAIAVISALFDADDIVAAAQSFSALFHNAGDRNHDLTQR